MIIDEFANDIDRPVGEAVSTRIEHPVPFQEPALVDLCAVCSGYCELHPALVKITYFRDEGVPDILVLDHDISFEHIARMRGERDSAEWSDQVAVFADLQSKDLQSRNTRS